jgi:hypothetical protein
MGPTATLDQSESPTFYRARETLGETDTIQQADSPTPDGATETAS